MRDAESAFDSRIEQVFELCFLSQVVGSLYFCESSLFHDCLHVSPRHGGGDGMAQRLQRKRPGEVHY